MISVAVLEMMRAKGLSLDDAIELAKVWEETTAKPVKGSAERMRRKRERDSNASQCDVTGDASRDAASLSLPPTPPNPIPTPPIVPPTLSVSKVAADIWAAVPRHAKKGSSKADVERTVKAALGRKADPARMQAACVAYYADQDPAFSKALHRLIENDRWEQFLPDEPAAPNAEDMETAVRLWRTTGAWSRSYGPPPDDPATRVPEALRAA